MQDELERIKKLLAENPKGMAISSVSGQVGLNRNAVAKYLNVLQAAGEVDMKPFGRSRIYLLSGRLPTAIALSLSSELMVLIDSNMQIIDANDQFYKFSGQSRSQIVGRSLENLGPGLLTHPGILLNVKEALNGKEYANEISILKDGEELFFKIKMIPVTTCGTERRVVMIGENITARKRAEVALRESEARFRAVVEAHTDFIIRILPDTTITFINNSVTRLLEKLHIDGPFRKLTDFLSPDESVKITRSINSITVENPSLTDVREVRFRNGSTRWMNVTFLGIFDNRRSLREIQVVASDVTNLKTAELTLEAANVELERRVEARTSALRESEEKFRALAETSPALIILHRGDRFLYANSAGERMTGFGGDELLRMNFWELVHPEFRELVKERGLARLRGEAVPPNYEFKILTKGGGYRWVDMRAGLIDYAGKPTSIVTLFDITERKLAEGVLQEQQRELELRSEEIESQNEELRANYDELAKLTNSLRESEEKFRVIAESTKAGIYLYRDDKLIYANPALEVITGYTNAELLSIDAWNIIHPDYRELVMSRARDRQRGLEVPTNYEYPLLTKNGKTRWIEIFSGLIMYEGKPTVMATYFDITDRKRAEEALRESEAWFRAIFEQAAVGIAHVSLNGLFASANDKYCDITGYTRAELLQLKYQDITPRDDRHLDDEEVNDLINGKATQRVFEKRYVRKDGLIVWVNLDVSLVRDSEGQPAYYIVVTQDISDRKLAEDALRESEEKFRVLAETTKAGICLYRDNRHIYVNPALEVITGYTSAELLSMVIWGYTHPDYRELVKSRVRDRERGLSVPLNYEFCIVTKGGETRWVEVSAGFILYLGKPTGIATFFDITDRKAAANAVLDSLKEKEVLLKEIHHRVKNNMQIISSLLSLQSRSIHDQEQLAAFNESQSRIRSMALIHEKLYQSSNFSQIEFTEYVKSLVKKISDSFSPTKDKVRCRVEGTPVYLTIEYAVPCGLILNELVSNSLKYAFPGDMTGEIVITILHDRDQFSMTVSDDGVGLPSGGAPEKVTSLGLELVNVLTQQVNGTLEIGPGPGASFKIAFNRQPSNDRV